MVLSAVDGGEGRAELRRYARLIQPAALYDHLVTSIVDFTRLEAAKLPSIPRFNFPSRKRFEREPNYLEDTSLVMALGHGLLLLDGGPVIRHLARWSEPKSLKRPNQLHCRNCRHEFKRSRQLGKT